MSDYQRYAVYYLPDDEKLARFGARWLGWDVAGGTPVEQFPVDGLKDATSTPRKYGFHGTLKPPFRLADDTTYQALERDTAALAGSLLPVALSGLKVSRIGKFLALVPDGESQELRKLAFECVRCLDRHRRPASEQELERRRAGGLTERQDALLLEWGYPYVDTEFRFHLTLTGKLEATAMDVIETAAWDNLPALPRPFVISSIALAGEREDGLFQEIQRYALTR